MSYEQIFLITGVEREAAVRAIESLGYRQVKTYEHAENHVSSIQFEAKGSRVYYIENQQIDVHYLNISGANAEEVREALEPQLPHYAHGTAFKRATSDPILDERVTALFHLALERDPARVPENMEVIDDFLHHEDAKVRQSAIVSTAYFEWGGVIPMLEELIERETDESNKQTARSVCERLRARSERLRAMWETLAGTLAELDTDPAIATALLDWLRGSKPALLEDVDLDAVGTRLRFNPTFRVYLLMNLELVIAGKRTLAEALDELATFDEQAGVG